MNDFVRLIDDCDSELGQSILKAGREDASDSRKGRVLAALGVGAAVSMTTKASFAMSALWKNVLVGSVVAASGVAGVAVYRAAPAENVERVEASLSFAAEHVHAQTSNWSRVSASKSDDAAVDTAAAVDDLDFGSVSDDGVEPASRAVRSGRGSREAASAAGLNEEVALLDKARSAVRAGRPGDALARLDEHSSRFPKGSLALEAQVLRVQALAAAGRTEEASRRAKRILSRSPNSVVAQRLRQYVIE